MIITTAGVFALSYFFEACSAVATSEAWSDFWITKAREDRDR
jgi:hypothetical protein